MSDASHAAEAHASHSHDAYEGKPADTIPPDEPHTPGWLPIVGAGLALAAIMAFALSDPTEEPAAEAAAPSATAAAAAPAPQPAERAEPQQPRVQRLALPGASGAARPPGLPSAMMRPSRRPPGAPNGATAPAQPAP